MYLLAGLDGRGVNQVIVEYVYWKLHRIRDQLLSNTIQLDLWHLYKQATRARYINNISFVICSHMVAA